MDDEIKERYKLQEAAETATRGNTVETKQMLQKLNQSVRDGSLKVFLPGSNIFYVPEVDGEFSEIKESDLLRSDVDVLNGGFTWVDRKYDVHLHEALHPLPDNLEAYWDDLNTWLTENEPRIKYKFQNPDTSAAEQTESQTNDSPKIETPQAIPNWKMRIQAEAAIRWHKYKRLNCSPTKRGIKRELAKWCRDNNVTTDGGIFPSEDYIYRHVTRTWDPPNC